MAAEDSSHRARTPKSARRPRLMRRQTKQSGPMHDALSVFDSQLMYINVMKGKLENLPPMNSRVVRIFLSSTFSDMGAERNCLMQRVNPRLKKFCRDNFGLEFQTIDMRWGVGDDVQLDHMGPRMCLQEIENSLAMSAGPYFICLLGQRYGNRPPAAAVDAATFNQILHALVDAGRDVSVLKDWYFVDDNSQPPIYVLRPICTLAEAADQEKLKAAKSQWWAAKNEILPLMQEGAKICHEQGILSHSELKNFTASVTEMEVMHGILEKPASKLHQTLAFIREFQDLHQQPDLSKGKISRFIDTADQVDETGQRKTVLDEEVYSLVKELNETVESRLDESHCAQFSLTWKDDNGVTMQSHADYLQKFCDQYCEGVERLVRHSVHESMRLRADDLYSEVLQHSTACVNYVQKFQGRQEILDQIQAYVQGSQTDPLVVHGDSGSGKTSLLGKAASLVRQWLPESHADDAIVLLRFLGTSPGTSSIRQTLKYLCRQLAIFGNEEDQEKCASLDDFKEVLNTFYGLLERMGQFRRIVVFLDSVDQLDASDGAYHLTWVRTPLPDNVKMVVSTLPNMFDLLKTFRGKLPNPDIYVEVTPLEPSLCCSIMMALLQEKGRTLQPDQWKLVEAAFEQCSLPIYVHLLYHQVLHWRSYQTVDESALRYSVREAIFHLFENLELKHGKAFTSHALAFITASRNGLSETELEDVLSLDDVVLADVFQHHLPPFIRIPPICWARLRHDIGSYLVEREADNIRVVFWYHRQFIEVAKEYFLSDESLRRSIHSILADYFLGLWSGRKKKFVYPSYIQKKMNLPEFSMEDRSVPEQPFVLRTDKDGTRQYNLRKMNELPWHLINADRMEEFYDYVVFDYDFLFHKLTGTSRYLLLRDLDLPLKLDVKFIKEAELVYNAIRLAAQSLVYDTINLSVDLIGRLLVYEDDSPRVKLLLDQCRHSQHALSNNCLIPKVQCFDSGSGLLYSSFDLGLGMGLVMPNGQMVAFSLVSNEITWFDMEGNEIKRFSCDYNLFLSMKYLTHSPIPDDCVVHVVSMRSKGGMAEDDVEILEKEAAKWHVQQEIDEYEACGKEVPQELQDKYERVLAGEIPEEVRKELKPLHSKADEEEEKSKTQDLICVDFLNGRVTRLMSLKSEWGVSSDDIEQVTKDFVLSCKDKSDSTGTCKLSLVSLTKAEKVQLDESGKVTVEARIGSQAFDTETLKLCFSVEDNRKEKLPLVLLDLKTEEQRSCDLRSCFKEMDEEQLKGMISICETEEFNAKKSSRSSSVATEAKPESESPADPVATSSSRLVNATTVEPVGSLMDDKENIIALVKVLNDEGGHKGWGYYVILPSSTMHPSAIVDTGAMIDTKYSQNFSSYSKRRMIFLLKSRSYQTGSKRGLIFDCERRRSVYLTVDPDNEYYKATKGFGDGTQAKFTEDERLLLTSGTKVLLLVWSVQTGQLLQGVKLGTAESFLCGQPRGTDFFTICHFPDESAPSDEERMYIMTKVYNLRYFYDDLEHEEQKMLPLYMQTKESHCVCYPGDPSSVEIVAKEKMRMDTRTLRVWTPEESKALEAEARTVCEEPLVQVLPSDTLHCSLLSLHDPKARKVIYGDLELPPSSFHGFNVRQSEEGVLSLEFTDFDRLRLLQSPVSNVEKIFTEGVSWLDETHQLLVRLWTKKTYSDRNFGLTLFNFVTGEVKEEKFTNASYRVSLKKRDDCAAAAVEEGAVANSLIDSFAEVIFKELEPMTKKKREEKEKEKKDEQEEKEKEKKDEQEEMEESQQQDAEEKEDDESLSQKEKDAKVAKFLKRNIGDKEDFAQVQPVPQESRVLLAVCQRHKVSECIRTGTGVPPIWLGRVVCIDYSDDQQPAQLQEGKIFDMGPAVAFLNDWQHLINYKLQVVHWMTGDIVRCLRPEEDLHFLRLQLTPDCSLLAAQLCFPAYEVEFAVFDDDSSMDSEMFAIQPPRGIQVYRVSDGARFANYLFESDPVGFCLVGEGGRDLLVLTHNAPIMIFNLPQPPELQTQTSPIDEQDQQKLQQISVRDAPGPKPEYLQQVAPALTKAMAEVANSRPADPIRCLAEALLRLRAEM